MHPNHLMMDHVTVSCTRTASGSGRQNWILCSCCEEISMMHCDRMGHSVLLTNCIVTLFSWVLLHTVSLLVIFALCIKTVSPQDVTISLLLNESDSSGFDPIWWFAIFSVVNPSKKSKFFLATGVRQSISTEQKCQYFNLSLGLSGNFS